MPPTSAPFRAAPGSRNERLWRGAQAVTLRPKPFAVLSCLAQRPGQLLTQGELRRAVWPETAVGEGGLAVCIRELRRALDDSANSPRLIETVHRRGYRLIGRVTVTAALPNAPRLAPSGPSPAPHVSRAGTDLTIPSAGCRAGAVREGSRPAAAAPARWCSSREKRGGQDDTGGRVHRGGEGPGGFCWSVAESASSNTGPEKPIARSGGLGRLCRNPQGTGIDVLARRAPTWLVPMPWLVETSDLEGLQPDPGHTRERMLREMAEATETLAAERPLVLVLEDLHWSESFDPGLARMSGPAAEPAQCCLVGLPTGRGIRVGLLPYPPSPGAWGTLAVLRAPADVPERSVVREYLARRFPAGAIPAGCPSAARAHGRQPSLMVTCWVRLPRAVGL